MEYKGTIKQNKPAIYFFTIAVNRQGKEIKLFRTTRMIKHGSD